MKRKDTRRGPAVALVTGASSGIGQACAKELSLAGLRVFGTSRHPRRARKGQPFPMLTLDVRDDASAADCVERVLSRAGRIDVLVNNAGVAFVGALEETGIDDFKNVIETNLVGAVRMMRAVLPIMRRQRYGRIVNMGSVMAFLPMPYSSAYCASKHAIRGLSESVDHEVRGLGIRVIAIEPGFIRTDIVQRSPVADPLEPYATARADPVRYFREQIEQGSEPALVARAVVQAATAADPQPRYLPDSYARLLHVTRGVLPSGWFDRFFRWYFRLS
jgi:NAD(P)-dependent dehydrogenase (short-subunit alcohol dehydrogenase family)